MQISENETKNIKKVKTKDGAEKKKSSNRKYKWLLISSPRMNKDESHPLPSSGLFNGDINASDYRSIASDSKMINI
jgi:hypothetical protein